MISPTWHQTNISLMTMLITPAFKGNPLMLTQQKYIHLFLTLFLRIKKQDQLSKYTNKKEMEERIGEL